MSKSKSVVADNNDRFYEPSKKQQKELLELIQTLIKKKGYIGFNVNGAFQPTLQINVPRRTKKDGSTDYTTYSVQVS
jgi:hypothetical protein